jgi:uncharacterized protein (TIGR03086 family)
MAHDWLVIQERVAEAFTRRVADITDWDAPTPDTDWTVRDLVRHVVEEQQWVPQLLAGRTVSRAKQDLEPLREDLAAEWQLYSLAAASAWRATPHDARVHLSYDTVTMLDYLREQVSDIAIHTWDLARAIGSDDQLDDDIVDAVWSVFEPQQETLAASGLYAPPVPLDGDVPLQWKLLAATGRDPR